MDRATLVGLAAGIVFLMVGMVSGGGSLLTFWNPQSVFITFGGTIGSVFISFTWEQMLSTGKVARNAFTTKAMDPLVVINHVVTFSEKARREGLLSLEKELSQAKDIPYLVKGLQLAFDGSDQDIVHAILEGEREAIEERHNIGIKIFEQLASLAPSWGMIGTVMGLILMLKNLSDPSAVGPSMAVALLTTLYGAVGAFFIFTPIANKLKIRSEQEMMLKHIIIQGILAIQAGDNPRMVKEKLVAYIAPKDKEVLDDNK